MHLFISLQETVHDWWLKIAATVAHDKGPLVVRNAKQARDEMFMFLLWILAVFMVVQVGMNTAHVFAIMARSNAVVAIIAELAYLAEQSDISDDLVNEESLEATRTFWLCFTHILARRPACLLASSRK